MDQKTLELLEYEKIQEMLAAQADTPMGRRLAKRAFPVDVHTARHRQKVGREIAQALGKTSLPVIPQVRDVTNLISGAMQGVSLRPTT